jgi:UDP-glucose 4-epimerase
MNIFVTGGAGFIGSHLVDALLKEDNTVTIYDNLSSGKKQFISHQLQKDTVQLIEADLIDFDILLKEIKNHDMVFHIAANPDVRIGEQKPEIAQKDILSTYNLLNAMRVNDIKKIAFSSSSTIYGETPSIPLPENYGPLLPISVYGAAKLASEGLISSFCHTFDIHGWIFRFANVVGERGTHGVIVDFINKLKKSPHELEILGDGKQRKPYLYVKDCVDGMLFGFNHSNEEINILNLGCDSVTEVTKIAEMVVEELELEDVTFNYTGGKRGWKGDVPHFQFDVKKINDLGWTAKYTSDDAVRLAIRDLLHTYF